MSIYVILPVLDLTQSVHAKISIGTHRVVKFKISRIPLIGLETRLGWRTDRQFLRNPNLNEISRKRDSSLNQILRQFRNVQPLYLLHQRTLSRLCNGVNTAPKYGLLGLMPCHRSRLRTVCELILRNPGIPAAVVDATAVRFRRWKTRCTDLAQE